MNDIEKELTTLVGRAVGDDGPGAILAVIAPHRDVAWRGAAGTFARDARKRLKASDGFRIASMSKTFTATLVMQLVEQGKLALSARLSEFLPRSFVKRVHPRASAITLYHLLNHTAGLWDFALSEPWGRELRSDPGKFRDPDDILEWAVSHGAPVGDVGEKHVYSDTGYVILGHVLQRVTGKPYKTLCRRRIFAPLGMKQTWLEGHEEPLTTLSHSYSGRWDGLQLNGSADWAAGGHVSTVDDLMTFVRGLFRDAKLVTQASIDQMLVSVPTENHRYGLGVGIRTEAADGKPRSAQAFWGHSGHWGSFMFYVPGWRATIAGTVNRAAQDNRWIFSKIVELLEVSR
jgi:D-alanyl-D-alanine carboxypeptidase